MAPRPPRSNARLLAPAALVLALLAVVVVLATSVGGGDGSDDSSGAPASDTIGTTTAKTTSAKAPPKKKPATYTVKTGDSLGSIAAKNDLTTEQLQELNPDVDPQSLVAGQKIKLTQ